METIKVNTQDIIKGVAELADKKQKEVREVYVPWRNLLNSGRTGK